MLRVRAGLVSQRFANRERPKWAASRFAPDEQQHATCKTQQLCKHSDQHLRQKCWTLHVLYVHGEQVAEDMRMRQGGIQNGDSANDAQNAFHWVRSLH
jgi:hypothetical protein